MARDGSGTYSLYTPGNPVVTGTTISSSAFNNTLNDIASALTLSIAADGQTPITANIPMGSFKVTGLGAGTTSGDALAYGQSAASLASLTVTTTLTGPTGVITSGTYTPTLTNGGNLSSSTAAVCQYIRVGNVVTVSGGFTAAAVTPGVTTMNVTLPVSSSNFATETQGAGTAAITESLFGKIRANIGAQTVAVTWAAIGSGSAVGSFSFTYLVV